MPVLRDRNHILRQICGKPPVAAQSAAPGQAGIDRDMQGVTRGDGLKDNAGGSVDSRRCALVPAVTDGSALVAFPRDICGTGSVHNAAGDGDAADAAGDRTTANIFGIVLIPTAAANACGIVASNSGHFAATDGDGAISALLASATAAANARTQIAACGVYHPAVNLDIVSRTAVANVTRTAADARAARLSSMRRCRDIAAVDGDTTAVSAVFTISSATTANTCAGDSPFAAVGGDRAAINYDSAAVAAVFRGRDAAADARSTIPDITGCCRLSPQCPFPL